MCSTQYTCTNQFKQTSLTKFSQYQLATNEIYTIDIVKNVPRYHHIKQGKLGTPPLLYITLALFESQITLH